MKKKSFIGIDISKKTLDVVLYSVSKEEMRKGNYLKIENNKTGFKEMLKWLKGKKVRLSESVVGMENTGEYGFDLRLFLESKSIDYTVYNPLDLKKSLGLTRGKDDRVDAARIAEHTYLYREKLVYHKLAGRTILRLRELLTERKRIVKQMAEYKGLITDGKGRHLTDTFRRSEKAVRFLEMQLEEVEEEMKTVIAKDAELLKNYHLLMGIKGIGNVNAIATLVHTNNFQAFENARQYACYIGIAPFGYESGTSVRGKTQVPRYKVNSLKADLSQAAKSAVMYDPELKKYYERKTGEGKHYGVVMNAVKFKLVCRMFAVIRRGTPFVNLPDYVCR